MYTHIYVKFGPCLTRQEMDRLLNSSIVEIMEYRSSTYDKFICTPYSGDDCQLGIGIKIDDGPTIFEQFNLTNFYNKLDLTKLNNEYVALLSEFKKDLDIFLNEGSSDEGYKIFKEDYDFINKVLEREPSVHFYYGTS